MDEASFFNPGVDVKVVAQQGNMPTQGYNKDFAYDLYTNKDVLILPSEISSVMVPLGVKTEFDSNKYGMIVVPRSSMSKLPLVMGNHVGVIEGDFRGEWQLPLRNVLVLANTSTEVLVVTTNGLERRSMKTLPKSVLEDTESRFERDSDLLGLHVGDEVEKALFKSILPSGAIFIPKGTRLAQAFLVEKTQINWIKSKKAELSNTDRGQGGFGSSGR